MLVRVLVKVLLGLQKQLKEELGLVRLVWLPRQPVLASMGLLVWPGLPLATCVSDLGDILSLSLCTDLGSHADNETLLLNLIRLDCVVILEDLAFVRVSASSATSLLMQYRVPE